MFEKLLKFQPANLKSFPQSQLLGSPVRVARVQTLSRTMWGHGEDVNQR